MLKGSQGCPSHSDLIDWGARASEPLFVIRPQTVMSLDVVDLRNFYTQQLGTLARQFIGQGIRTRWSDTRGERVVGLGYTTPYLGLFRAEAERCLAFMPAAQGVIKWPSARPALAALVEEYDLPLPDLAVDRMIVVHALEMTDDAPSLLREIWRVLAPGDG